MPLSRRWTDIGRDEGSASIEFLTVGLLLTLPLVYLVLALAQLQAAALATEGAARQAARVLAVAEDQESGLAAADASIEVALANQGLDADAANVVCAPNPVDCTTRDGTVQVSVEVVVPMPLAPPVLGLDERLAVPISATAAQPVSGLRP